MFSRAYILALGCALVFGTFSLAGGVQDLSLKDRFFREAPPAWERYLTFARGLQVTVSTRPLAVQTENPFRPEADREIKQTRDGAVEIIFPHKSREATARGTNRHYNFHLHTLNHRRAQRVWAIDDVRMANMANQGWADEHREIKESILRDVCECLKLTNLWLPELIREAGFKVTGVKDQNRLVRVDFEYHKPKADDSLGRLGGFPVARGEVFERPRFPWREDIAGGWMLVDPDRDWVLREFEVFQLNPKGFLRREYEIGKEIAGRPIITAVRERIRADGSDEVLGGRDITIKSRLDPDLPETECMISSFGMPEPPRDWGVPLPPQDIADAPDAPATENMFVVVLGTVIVLVGLFIFAALMGWFPRRRRT